MAGKKENSPTSAGATPAATAAKARKARIAQEDVPGYSLEQALRVPRAIAENYAYNPTRPMNVANAMGMTPTAGPFRGITGAAVAYGLTTGAAQAPEIGLTPIGLRVVRPTVEGDDIAARREALLKPRIIGEFLRDYDGAALPADNIAQNVLQQKGVPAERTEDVLALILEGAKDVGFLREWGGKRYVDLTAQTTGQPSEGGEVVPARSTAQPSTGSLPPIVMQPSPTPAVSVGAGVHINIEIHIAADASSQTIEDIFRNMKRYVLSTEPDTENAE